MYPKTDATLDSEKYNITIRNIKKIQHVSIISERYNNKY